MIRTKPITEITFADVVEFCKKDLPEGRFVDYKEDFPKALEKTIAAMANTYGGIVIVGVKDENDKPKPPFEGFEFKDDYRAKVENIILDNISPPVFVEISNCRNPLDHTKTFVVIRIPQSASTPHALAKQKNAIYVRTGQSSNPEDIISPAQLQWLYNARARSTDLKDLLRRRSQARFLQFMSEIGLSGLVKYNGPKNAVLTLSMLPFFPQGPLYDFVESEQILLELSRQEGLQWEGMQFKRLVQGGVYFSSGACTEKDAPVSIFSMPNHNSREGTFACVELDEHGLIEFRIHASESGSIDYLKLVYFIMRFLAASRALYKRIGYFGLLEFRCELSGVAGAKVTWANLASPQALSSNEIIDEVVGSIEEVNSATLEGELEALGLKVLRKLAWGCSLKGANDALHLDIIFKNNLIARRK